MLLSTPITVQEIVRGTWMAIRHRLVWTYVPLVLLLAGGGMALVFLGEGRIPVVLFFAVQAATFCRRLPTWILSSVSSGVW